MASQRLAIFNILVEYSKLIIIIVITVTLNHNLHDHRNHNLHHWLLLGYLLCGCASIFIAAKPKTFPFLPKSINLSVMMIILLHLLLTMMVIIMIVMIIFQRANLVPNFHTYIAFSFCGHIQSSIFLAARHHHEVLKSAYPQVFQLANLFWELLQAILVKVQHLQQNVKPKGHY